MTRTFAARVALVAAALISLLAAGTATAKPKAGAKPKGGTFELRIEGEQLTTWKYEKVMEPQCDFPESASGRQYIQFRTYKYADDPPKVKVKRGPGGGVKIDFVRKDVELWAQAELERKYSALYAQMTPCPGGGEPNGGDSGGAPVDASGTYRCTTRGGLPLSVGASIEDVESQYYTSDLVNRKPPKAPLYFAAEPGWSRSTSPDRNLPSACDASGQPNVAIGLDESQGEWAGGLIPVVSSLPARKLLNSKSKMTVIELGRTVSYPNETQTYAGPPKTSGKTRIDVTMTFTRVR